jgi:serine/threonine protein kinase
MPEFKQRDYQFRWKPTRSHYRLKRTLLHRLAVVAGICCAVQIIQLHVQARHSLEAKFTTTRFENDAEVSSLYNNISSTFDRDGLLAARSDWRLLGSGCEGSAFTWNGLVIKAYKTTRSRFRNCLSSSLVEDLGLNDVDDYQYPTRWPTEIPATLLAGSEPGFLPARDAFFASSSPTEEAQWHLVTPLARGGTLQTLARQVSQSAPQAELSIQSLDSRFRPKFNDLLLAIQYLHMQGLCHDDIKPDNIFVGASGSEEDGPWILGDLGNARHLSHPYHASRVWTQSNNQLPDCRANDALRAVKTYLQFLRQISSTSSAMRPEEDFNLALSDAKESWARLFWLADSAGNDLRIDEVMRWAAMKETNAVDIVPTPHRNVLGFTRAWLLSRFVGWQDELSRAADVALEISASDGWTRKLALTWFLGVPIGRC